MQAVLLSVQPYWCGLIAAWLKTAEIRKSVPKLTPPFKCYIYCTLSDGLIHKTPDRFGKTSEVNHTWKYNIARGKVIGEFVCDKTVFLGNISTDPWPLLLGNIHEAHKKLVTNEACLTEEALRQYGGKYAWHISEFVLYDQPKDVGEFWQSVDWTEDNCIECPRHEVPVDKGSCKCCDGTRKYLRRPPQSWCYVGDLAG